VDRWLKRPTSGLSLSFMHLQEVPSEKLFDRGFASSLLNEARGEESQGGRIWNEFKSNYLFVETAKISERREILLLINL
jgi:hypothetical protein